MDTFERRLSHNDEWIGTAVAGLPRGIESVDADRAPLGELRVERVGLAGLAAHDVAWADLCTRTIEPNIFLEPGFAQPLFQHLARRGDLDFLLVWEESGRTTFGRLLALLPLGRTRLGLACGLVHEQIGCGTPLVDREHAVAALAVALDWMTARDVAGGLVLSQIPTDGPFHRALADACATSGHPLRVLDSWQRAILIRRDYDPRVVCLTSAKRRKERARQSRKLSKLGLRTYTIAETPAEVARATERFLALELEGWKGARGSALLAAPERATFTRAMTRLMARTGQCRIEAIELDGRPVAMGIVLTTGDRSYFWKTAFDESYAAYSPGVLFTLELTHRQLQDGNVATTDSCALPNHPMINRVWLDRLTVADLVVGTYAGRRFATLATLERGRRALRRQGKQLWLRLTGRKSR